MIHDLLIVIIILVILFFQISFFVSTISKIKKFKGIFSKNTKSEWSIVKVNKQKTQIVLTSFIKNKNAQIDNLQKKYNEVEASLMLQDDSIDEEVLKKKRERLQKILKSLNEVSASQPPQYVGTIGVIINAINSYLGKNSNLSDFQLIKDIVDRNCDAKEEEIQTQIPVPLYLGLMGTMFGILVGVGFLVGSGGLSDLLNSTTTVGAEGIETLLWGVAMAMICSIVGILLTTIASNVQKKAKIHEEECKHDFLSWIQAELLPKLSSDVFSSMEKMSRNLSKFNDTFASNTEQLNSSFSTNTNQLNNTLQHITESTKGQAELLSIVNDLKLKKIATANIEVYEKLKSCTDEIGSLSIYLHSINEYLTQVKELTMKVDDAQERTKMIEEMATYFRDINNNLDMKNRILFDHSDDSIRLYERMIDVFKEKLEDSINKLAVSLNDYKTFTNKIIKEQDKVLETKTEELSAVVKHLNQLPKVEAIMKRLEDASKDQGRYLESMSNTLTELAKKRGVDAAPVVVSKKFDIIKLLPLIFYGILSVTSIAILIILLLNK